jgi:hypothetical protein
LVDIASDRETFFIPAGGRIHGLDINVFNLGYFEVTERNTCLPNIEKPYLVVLGIGDS